MTAARLRVMPTNLMAAPLQHPPVLSGEFWTARQRQAKRLHEIAYRGCFKPQLPAFFISQYTRPGDLVYDPFSGRGTTAVEAALSNRRVAANDVNPLSAVLTRPRLSPPLLTALTDRLAKLPLHGDARAAIDLSMFYHPQTESQIVRLRRYLRTRLSHGEEDDLDRWIRMIATNRLSGHSSGFFSAYTLPPNLAASPERQRHINKKLRQSPPLRDIKELITKKSRQLLSDVTATDRAALAQAAQDAIFCNDKAEEEKTLSPASVNLVVTSPPFLDTVQYANDNWLRCWFNDIDAQKTEKRMTLPRSLTPWCSAMEAVLARLYDIVVPGGWVAFEAGEIRQGKIRLAEEIAPLGERQKFKCVQILINQQSFTKTANIWGVKNNRHGTNTNRVVIFQKPD